MKAAWIRNFWTKTVAFLLAAALVPVILTYVVGLVYSYGGMGRDFYTSNLCLNAVGKKTWEICDDYIAMEGGNYELDKIYSKGDSYSNLRFRVTDEQDKVEFSNVSDDDTFCYSTVYNDKTFDVYLVKDLPAQDDIYWAKVFLRQGRTLGPERPGDAHPLRRDGAVPAHLPCPHGGAARGRRAAGRLAGKDSLRPLSPR